YGSDDIYKADRNEMILKTILALNTWSENDKIKARSLIQDVFNIALDTNSELFLSDGALLGYVRHGQIMGWDDDIDLSINVDHLDRFLKGVEENDDLNFCKWHWGKNRALYYKIWDDSGLK